MTRVNRYRMPFLMPVNRFAARAAEVIEAGSSYRVIPWQMGIAAKLLTVLPNWLYDQILARAPHKARAAVYASDGVGVAPAAAQHTPAKTTAETTAASGGAPPRS